MQFFSSEHSSQKGLSDDFEQSLQTLKGAELIMNLSLPEEEYSEFKNSVVFYLKKMIKK